jgi:hypothetical protein
MRIIAQNFFLFTKVGSKPEFEASYHNWKRVSMKLASTRELADSLASLAAACNDPGKKINALQSSPSQIINIKTTFVSVDF